MKVTRRDFIKISGASAAGLMLGSLLDLEPIKAYAKANPPEWEKVTITICCYCAVGCGILVGTQDDTHVTYVQGDPDHPINRGALCSKGQAIGQLRTVNSDCEGNPIPIQDNPKRLTQPLYRAPGSTAWVPMDWNTALTMIAQRIHDTRNSPNAHHTGTDPNSPVWNTTLEDWIEDPDNPGVGDWHPANRCTGVACLGGAAHDTEECYLLVKLMRALGLVYLEHQARI
ncbi:MAG: twin-arginine translocation signal domain-containing protein [Thermodesulfobacteriota bacterium]|nr:twin-arginine translocation signal domain-containing protein [Thermodesulfobacteriota bacterium]